MTAKIIAIKDSPSLFYGLLAGILLSAALYIYCVNAAVRNVVARKEAEVEISILRNKVSDLEYQYIEKDIEMTLGKAKDLGLLPPEQKVFISKNSGVESLSLNKP